MLVGPVDIVAEPEFSSGEREETEERGYGFVVSVCGASRLLQSVEQALDMIAIAVASQVAGGRHSTVRLGRDDGQNTAPKRVFADDIPVIPLVGEQGSGFGHGHVDQSGHGSVIRHFAARQGRNQEGGPDHHGGRGFCS